MMKPVILFCALAARSFAALPSGIVWEVRQTGSNSNSGGFVAGAAGTDYSQQDAAQFSGANLASSNGSTNPCAVTSGSHNFIAADVGNLIQITTGPNWNAGFYQIVSTASNTATLDRACGTTPLISGGIWAEGGALQSPATVLVSGGPQTTNSKLFLKYSSTPYSISAALTITAGQTPSPTSYGFMVIGYNAVRTDGYAVGYANRPTIQISSGTGVSMISSTVSGTYVYNLILDCNSQATSIGASLTGNYASVYNTLVKGCDTGAIKSGGQVLSSEITGLTTNAAYGIQGSGVYTRNVIHDTGGASGFAALQNSTQGGTFAHNLIYNLTSASGCTTCDGIQFEYLSTIISNTIYNVSRDGIREAFGSYPMNTTYDNVVVAAAGNGFTVYTSNGFKSPFMDGDCFYGNGANTANDTATSGVNGSTFGPYGYQWNVVDAANNLNGTSFKDFRLKVVSACARTAQPGVMPEGVVSGITPFGAFGSIAAQANAGAAQ